MLNQATARIILLTVCIATALLSAFKILPISYYSFIPLGLAAILYVYTTFIRDER